MLMELLSILTPVLVAATTAFGAVLVAKVQRMQKYMTTNHGTAGLGDATDKILEKVESISDQQQEIILAIDALKSRDAAIEARMKAIEKTRSRVMKHIGLEPLPGEVPPEQSRKKKFFLWRRRM